MNKRSLSGLLLYRGIYLREGKRPKYTFFVLFEVYLLKLLLLLLLQAWSSVVLLYVQKTEENLKNKKKDSTRDKLHFTKCVV